MKNIITGVLSKAFKLDDGKINELLGDGENVNESEILSAILEIDKNRVEEIKRSVDQSGKFQEGYAKAKKEERIKFETEIKDKFDLETDKTGTDLIEEIIGAKSTKNGELTEQDIKKSETYRKMEGDYKKRLTETETQYQERISGLENQYKKEKTFISVKDRANNLLQELNPILPKVPKVAQTIKNNFLAELNAYDYEIAEDGSVIVSKGGTVLEDGHGHSRGFDDLVKEVAGSYFEFSANNGGANAGNANQGGSGGGGGSIPQFKTEAEMFEYSNNKDIPLADRLKAVEKFTESNV